MASNRSTIRRSTAVTRPGQTILKTAVRIMAESGNVPLSPQEIADLGQFKGLLRVPRGRTENYLNQLIQSALYNNILYSAKPSVQRLGRGRYKARKAALVR